MISNELLKKRILNTLITDGCYELTTLSKIISKNNIGDGDWILSDDMCSVSNNKLIQLGSIGYGHYIQKPLKFINDETFDRIKCSEITDGALLLNRFISNNQMNACIVPKIEGRVLTSVDVCWVKEDSSKYLNKYLMYCFLTDQVQKNVLLKSSGTTRVRISKSNLVNIFIPLPSIEEQRSIVDKIEELFELIDKKEKNDQEKNRLKEFLKEKILDSAIRGKLVKNDLSLEPVEVESITEDIPFEIPVNWKWTYFKRVIDVRDGTHDSPKYVESSDYPLITSKNLTKNGLDFSNVNYLKKVDYDKINKRSFVDDGDILFGMIGSIGNPVIVKKYRDFAIKNVALFKCGPAIYNKYLLYYLFNQKDMSRYAKGGVQKFVALKVLRNYPIPLPPLEEQKRIVDKIDKCFELIDQL